MITVPGLDINNNMYEVPIDDYEEFANLVRKESQGTSSLEDRIRFETYFVPFQTTKLNNNEGDGWQAPISNN